MTPSTIDPFDLGEGRHGVQVQIGHILTPASYESLPAPSGLQIPTLWIHTSGGRGGGALILDRCRAFDLFASVDAHLLFLTASRDVWTSGPGDFPRSTPREWKPRSINFSKAMKNVPPRGSRGICEIKPLDTRGVGPNIVLNGLLMSQLAFRLLS